RVEDGEGDFDPAVEVARHPVRGGEEVLRLPRVVEIENPGVFQVAVDDGDDADVFGQAGHARAQTADAAHDQVDLRPRLTGCVECLDQGLVHQAVDLGDEARRPAGQRLLGLAADAHHQRVPEVEGGHKQVVKPLRPRVARQEVEQFGE